MKRYLFGLILGLTCWGMVPVCSSVGQTADPRFAGGILSVAGTPSNGVNAVETLTFGGTITGGTFRLAIYGDTTAAVAWSATNATLVANISAALVSLPSVGTGGVTVAVGTMTAGIGTITVTAAGNLGNAVLPVITVASNALTGTAPTLAAAITTAGVQADGRKSLRGQLCTDTANGILYINTGGPLAPVWIKVGQQ